MDKQYLRKRHNVWWVRMRIPVKAKEIMGKTELWKNLHTTDLFEANSKKHYEIDLMYKEIAQAKRDYEGMADKLSKEVQISKYAEYLQQSTVSEGDRYDYYGEKDYSDDHSIVLGNLLEGKLDELSGSKEADAILHGEDPQWQGIEPNTLAKKNFIEAHKLTDQSYSPLSLVSKKFLAEDSKILKNSSYRRKQTHIEHFIKWTGNRDITKINKKIVGDYVTSIIQNNNPASATISNTVSNVGSFFRWAEGRGYIEYNPFSNLNLPKRNKGSQNRKPWSDENIMTFLKSELIGVNELIATCVSLYSGMRLDEICNIQKTVINDNCFKVLEGKTKASQRIIPIHPVLKPLVERFMDSKEEVYLIKGIKGGGYDNKRSWNFQKKLGRLRKKIGIPEGVVFHTLRNTFATKMENLGIPMNHISQIMGHEDSNMALDIYSAGLAIEPLVKSMKTLTYGKDVDSFIKNTLIEKSTFL
jgi:integrase